MSQAVTSEAFGGCVLPSCGNGTVSVGETTTGEPGTDAKVSNSGTNKHVILDFEIPRGPAGVESVSVSIPASDTPGTPTVTATLEDGEMTLAFEHLKGEKGDKGDQGNTGSSVDYPYELVNNLTTDDAEKGLSAAQGVVLEGEISNLQAEIDAIQPIIIEGDVTNAPDEEDITTDANDLLKFADRPTAVNQMGYVILRKNKTFAEQVTKENTIYEIRYAFDLGGDSVTIPAGCVLYFKGGSLSNGALNGSDLYFSGNYAESLNVSLSGTNITPDFRIGASTDNEINRSKIQTATGGIVICGDITLAQNTSLNCDLRGIDKNVSITAATNMNYALLVTKPNVTISNITIKKLIAAGATDEYTRGAIWGYANNLTIKGCIIYGAIEYLNQTTDTPLRGLYVRDNTIVADFTNITDNLYAQKDVFTFRGASDIFVTGNLITATKVLRVFKSTAKLSTPDDYTTQILNPENIHIEDNVIKSVTTSAGGKQFFDLYVGTLSAYVRDNYIYTRGHTCLIENKTVTSVGTPAHIVVSGNIIDTDSQLSFISMTKGDVTEWVGNTISLTGYTQSTEVFNIHGAGFIFEHNDFSFSGNQATTFALDTETSGSHSPIPFAKINKNILSGTRRVDCKGIDYLEYCDNDVTTSDQQINVNYNGSLLIDIRQRIYHQLTTPILVVQAAISMANLKVILDLGRTTQMVGRALANTAAAKMAYVSAVTSDIPLYGYDSSNAIYQLNDTYAQFSTVSAYYLGSQTAKVFLTGADYGYQIYYNNSGWHAYDGGAICKRKGDTASRPTLVSADAGTVYYDTDLGHYVVFDGTSWVDNIGDINSILSTI